MAEILDHCYLKQQHLQHFFVNCYVYGRILFVSRSRKLTNKFITLLVLISGKLLTAKYFKGYLLNRITEMALSPDRISLMLECKICLDTYNTPKHLNCGHTYCHGCLDDILSFNEDGSAELNCPLRCSNKTIINEHETTSYLPTSYCLADILNNVEENGKGNALCRQTENCKQPVRYFCRICAAKICEKCQKIHSCENKSFVTVSFNEKLQEIHPLCSQHNSLAKQVCIECDSQFVCVYCVHREHKGHNTKSITEYGIELNKHFQTFEDTIVELEKLSEIYHKTLMKLECERKVFVQELEMRKLKCIERYLSILNEEEKNMLKDFDEKSEKFKAEIMRVGCIDRTKMKEFTDEIKAFKLKSNFELIAEKVEVERKLRNLSSLPPSIATFNSHLQQLNMEKLSRNPLGKLKISIDEVKSPTVISGASSPCKNLIEGSEKCFDFSRLAIDLSRIMESLKGDFNITLMHCIAYSSYNLLDVQLKFYGVIGVIFAQKKCSADYEYAKYFSFYTHSQNTYRFENFKCENAGLIKNISTFCRTGYTCGLVKFNEIPLNTEKGYHPCDTTAATTVRTLENERWYFGCITREESIRYLKHPENKSGAFLIRKSENPSNGQLYVLSMLKGDFVSHFSIKRKFVLSKMQECNSLNELLHHCKRDWPLGEPCIKVSVQYKYSIYLFC
ncbi:E3 ubiquitin-protein ligase TRIM56-like [Hydractinia symbiolongicarpus]|uniref:E3 ubiquitin-protein ligase TRIM56-like n=1 Tax=Hydractinia symbiolongicarpus TaxID=13093 RepID=UPI00254B77FC|nr:E3 ubiquitin-protein ligase TRIM56-like [Hydractinia symbiolongicarpus]